MVINGKPDSREQVILQDVDNFLIRIPLVNEEGIFCDLQFLLFGERLYAAHHMPCFSKCLHL